MQDFWLLVGEHVMTGFSMFTLLLFFLAAVLLLVVMKKDWLLFRPNRWHALFVKLYYLYIPVVFLILGFMWATVGSLEQAFLAACEDSKPAITEASVVRTEAVLNDLAEHLPKDTPVSLKEISLAMSRDYVKRYTENTVISDYSALLYPMVGPLQEGFAMALAAGVEDLIVDKAAGLSRLEPETVRTLWSVDILKAMQGGLAVEILTQQIKATFPSYYRHVKILGCILLVPIALEILISMLVIRMRRKPAVA